MKNLLKILWLLLAVSPIWLTIMAMGQTRPENFSDWKDKINSKLLTLTTKRVQLIEIVSSERPLTQEDDALLTTHNFEVDISSIRPQGLSPIEVKFLDEKGRLKKLYRFVSKASIQEQVPVAVHSLAQGKVLEREDFKVEWRDAANFRSNPLNISEVVGRVVRARILEDEPIYEPSTAPKMLVARGDRVKVNVMSPGIMLSTFAIAEEDGARGQLIKILQVESRKEMLGVVLDDRSVEVRL